MTKKTVFNRVLILAVCSALVFCLACPAFAAEGPELDYQYVFSMEFTFADIQSVGSSGWRFIPFDVSSIADKVYADYVIFSLDDYEYRCKFMVENRGSTYHYIGSPYAVMGFGDEGSYPFCLLIDETNPGNSRLYFTQPLINSLFHGDTVSVHVALSVAYDEPMTTSSLVNDTTTVFGSAIGMVGSVVSTVASNPILYLPIVIGLCGIGVAFFRRLKQ